jgi:hypothetical protein
MDRVTGREATVFTPPEDVVIRKRWYVGNNEPGAVSTEEPKRFDTWAEARSHLRTTVGEQFTRRVSNTSELPTTMGEYTVASAVMRRVDPDHPFAFFYDGRVWWVADL